MYHLIIIGLDAKSVLTNYCGENFKASRKSL